MKKKPKDLSEFRAFRIVENVNLSGVEHRPIDEVCFVRFSVIEDFDFAETRIQPIKESSVST